MTALHASSDSIFRDEGDGRFAPTGHARGPWDPRALHGGAPAALIAAAFERLEPGAELPFARLSFSFLRPIPMAPLTLSTRVTRPGRRVQELAADLYAGDELVCHAHGLRIVPAPQELPELARALLAERAAPPLPGPEHGQPVRFTLDGSAGHESFAATAIEMRFLQGRPLAGELPEHDSTAAHTPVGTAQVWMRLRHPLVPGEPLTPLARAAAASDFGNGVAAVLPFERYVFINADLSLTLDRGPHGEWIALDARTLLHPGGIAWAESVLHDARGPFGRARQALVVQPR